MNAMHAIHPILLQHQWNKCASPICTSLQAADYRFCAITQLLFLICTEMRPHFLCLPGNLHRFTLSNFPTTILETFQERVADFKDMLYRRPESCIAVVAHWWVASPAAKDSRLKTYEMTKSSVHSLSLTSLCTNRGLIYELTGGVDFSNCVSGSIC